MGIELKPLGKSVDGDVVAYAHVRLEIARDQRLATLTVKGPAADLPGDAVPKPEPKSRYGNGPEYEVFGKRYTVMPSSAGYKERGVASWYGKKFHGNLTSNR